MKKIIKKIAVMLVIGTLVVGVAGPVEVKASSCSTEDDKAREKSIQEQKDAMNAYIAATPSLQVELSYAMAYTMANPLVGDRVIAPIIYRTFAEQRMYAYEQYMATYSQMMYETNMMMSGLYY